MPDSQAQVKMARAVLSGKAGGPMPKTVAHEIVEKMHGKKMGALPKYSSKVKAALAGKCD